MIAFRFAAQCGDFTSSIRQCEIRGEKGSGMFGLLSHAKATTKQPSASHAENAARSRSPPLERANELLSELFRDGCRAGLFLPRSRTKTKAVPCFRIGHLAFRSSFPARRRCPAPLAQITAPGF